MSRLFVRDTLSHTAVFVFRADSPHNAVVLAPKTVDRFDLDRGPADIASWPCDLSVIESLVSVEALSGVVDTLRKIDLQLATWSRREVVPRLSEGTGDPKMSLLSLTQSFQHAASEPESNDPVDRVRVAMGRLWSFRVMCGYSSAMNRILGQSRLLHMFYRVHLTFFYLQVHSWNRHHGPDLIDGLWEDLLGAGIPRSELGPLVPLGRLVFEHLRTPLTSRPECLSVPAIVTRPIGGESTSPFVIRLARFSTPERNFRSLVLQAIHLSLFRPFLPPSMVFSDVHEEMRVLALYSHVSNAFWSATGSLAFATTDRWTEVLVSPSILYAADHLCRRPRLPRMVSALAKGGDSALRSLSASIRNPWESFPGARTRVDYAKASSFVLKCFMATVRQLEFGVRTFPDGSLLEDVDDDELTPSQAIGDSLVAFFVFLTAIGECVGPPSARSTALTPLHLYFEEGRVPGKPGQVVELDQSSPLMHLSPSVLMFRDRVIGGDGLTSKSGISALIWWCVTGQGAKTRRFADRVGLPRSADDLLRVLRVWSCDDGPCDDVFRSVSRCCSFTGKRSFVGGRDDMKATTPRVRSWFDPCIQTAWQEWLGEDHGVTLEDGRIPTKSWNSAHDFLSKTLSKHGFQGSSMLVRAVNLLSHAGLVRPARLEDMLAFVSHKQNGCAIGMKLIGLPIGDVGDRDRSFRFLFAHLDRRLPSELRDRIDFSPSTLEHLLRKFYLFVDYVSPSRKRSREGQSVAMRGLVDLGPATNAGLRADFLRLSRADVLSSFEHVPPFLVDSTIAVHGDLFVSPMAHDEPRCSDFSRVSRRPRLVDACIS